MKICRHCHRCKASRPRGLCWNCYHRPGVRELYPPTSKFGYRGDGNFYGNTPLPAHPTVCLPGTREKVEVLSQRARLRQSLWHPSDATFTKSAPALQMAG